MSTVTLKPDGLYIDDKRFDMLSGDIHYFRIYPGGLRRRLEYAKAFGLNTIQTYCPWNLHEPKKGEFNFSGMLDLKGFLELADEMGFKVLLRPSPYICSEMGFRRLARMASARGNGCAFLRRALFYPCARLYKAHL